MKRLALITAAAAALAAPALADTSFAIERFNMDADSIQDVRMVPTADETTTVSTRGASPLGEAFDRFNASQDSVGELRGRNSATVVLNNHNATASAIFADLRAQSAEDE